MERRQLEFFLAIAEAGSFTSAAARLHVAQPSLSYAVRGLERELGGALFERHGGGVRRTPGRVGADRPGPPGRRHRPAAPLFAEIGLIATPAGTALRTFLDARLEAAGLRRRLPSRRHTSPRSPGRTS